MSEGIKEVNKWVDVTKLENKEKGKVSEKIINSELYKYFTKEFSRATKGEYGNNNRTGTDDRESV